MLDIVNRPTPAPDHLGMTTEIVAAYVSHNSVPVGELTSLLRGVYEALVSVSAGPVSAAEPEVLKPAVPIKRSIQDEFIVCLENGKRFKSLKRHLATTYGLTPDMYRAKWGLPKDYPMVAPAYAQSRSNLARQMGLGRKSGDAQAAASEPEAEPASPARTGLGAEGARPAKRRRKADAGS